MQSRKDGSSSAKSRSSLLGFFSRRSTKVEPHPSSDESVNLQNDTQKRTINARDITAVTAFARCSPVKRVKQNRNHNHSSHSDTEDNPIISISLNNKNNNRFSHQFSLCCSIDNKSQTPPVSVRYNSLPDAVNVRAQYLSKSLPSTDLENKVPSHSAPESPLNGKYIPQSTQSSRSAYSNKSGASDTQPRSIAITACRSRLRLKLLPPGRLNGTVDIANGDLPQQHSSSPNISAQTTTLFKELENVKAFSHENVQSIHRNVDITIPSTDSLARQALMAAQVLNLIPTEKARERNYLAGRLAINSLLGPNELSRVLPTREVKIFVGTWNMNGQNPPKQMNDFVLPTGVEHVPDIVVIGTQESCSERFEWEVILQETLGPTHILLHSTSLGTLHLAIFIRRDLIWFCSVPEDASMSVRPGTAFRTKGAVAISFSLFGTSMLFVTSHLTAHQQKVKERVQDVKRIIHALDLPKNLTIRNKCKDVTQNFDSVYWCGDLNFRLSEPREKLLKWIETTKFPLPSHLPHGYMHTDQLSSVLSDGAAFKGFLEANITFPPTYKYDPGTQQFDTSSKQRAPAYTDRILYKYKMPSIGFRRCSTISGPFLSQQTPPVECLAYDSVPSIITSDHKPVWALFRNSIRSGSDSIPLAAGLFNREVYLEGMRRRLNNTNSESSAVCSIQ